MANSRSDAPSVFLSYSSDDKQLAICLAELLKGAADTSQSLEVSLDRNAGQDWLDVTRKKFGGPIHPLLSC